ncbi:MAG: hypothetical protein WB729_07790 [Candidatus Sulfotelmatobacter sp.]
MILTIDNLQGSGPQDYTTSADCTVPPKIARKFNKPAQLQFSLLANSSAFVVPAIGARVILNKNTGGTFFAGYTTQAPQYQCIGSGQAGPVYRYNVTAESDEVLLDQKALPNRAAFVNRTAGSALRQLAQDLLPGWFNVTGVEDVDTLATYLANPQKKFSVHAADIALACRGSYRAMNGALSLAPVGALSYTLSETDADFSPMGLQVINPYSLANDITVIGLEEPQAYVRDYFVGDGLSLNFYLSQTPFAQSQLALIDEEFSGPTLDAATWTVSDPSSAISVVAQTLRVNGGTGHDGETTVNFIEQVELGGALELQHGDVSFAAASQGVLGGLYASGISSFQCLAGFQITPSGAGSNVQALIEGNATGPVIATEATHRYVLTTYVYSMEVYRTQETFHSSLHPAGTGRGGVALAADVRFVLEIQDIDPANPATLVAPATVLYDGVIQDAPGFCSYVLVNAENLYCSIAYTYVSHISLAEVRTALPEAGYVTQLAGSLSDGAQCEITSVPSVDFYPQYSPPLNQLIVVSYRGQGRAVAEVNNPASIASLEAVADNGVRGSVLKMSLPQPRTDADCENAALAILDDAGLPAWAGAYQVWSDFLPGMAADIFPGDELAVNVPSRGASFTAIVRQVGIELLDPANDRGFYQIEFANDRAQPLGAEVTLSATVIALQDMPPVLASSQVGAYYLVNLSNAQITQVTSTTVQIDAGVAPANGTGVEVREHDYGWGQSNDRNLLGRFSVQAFTLPRLARTQNYFLRLYDSSSPPRYSRYSAALHVDYPLNF